MGQTPTKLPVLTLSPLPSKAMKSFRSVISLPYSARHILYLGRSSLTVNG